MTIYQYDFLLKGSQTDLSLSIILILPKTLTEGCTLLQVLKPWVVMVISVGIMTF